MNLIHTIFEPEGAGPHPTLLMLHGRGANALDLLGLAPYLCSGRLLVICPQAPLQVAFEGGGVGYEWYPFVGPGRFDLQTILAAREELRTFLAEAMQRYPMNSKKLAGLGVSQGGRTADSLGFGTPERFAGPAAIVSW